MFYSWWMINEVLIFDEKTAKFKIDFQLTFNNCYKFSFERDSLIKWSYNVKWYLSSFSLEQGRQ